jgi:hypothetical protein
VADADDGSFVVDDMSLLLIRGCLSFSGLDDTLLESFLSDDALDDIMHGAL